MNNPSIQEAMTWPWQIQIVEDPAGDFRGTVMPNLPDFEIYGTKEEIEAEWKDALETHLRAYIRAGKCIPIPHMRVETPQTTGSKPPQLFSFSL